MKEELQMIIYFDGGCNPNPGKMEICIVVLDQNKKTPHVIRNLGRGTSNIAEWSALLFAATHAKELGLKKVTFVGDSKLVVNQAKGLWRINKQNFVELKKMFENSVEGITWEIRHLPRDYNLAGIYLEKGRI